MKTTSKKEYAICVSYPDQPSLESCIERHIQSKEVAKNMVKNFRNSGKFASVRIQPCKGKTIYN